MTLRALETRRYTGAIKSLVAMDSGRVIFVSAVSDEFHKVPPESRHNFQSYRDVVRQAFRILAPHYEIIVQEDLPQGFGDLLQTLDHEIARSLFVIHLVGDLAGFAPDSAPLRKLHTRHPDLLDCVPELRDAVGPGAPRRGYRPQQSGGALQQPRSIREGRTPSPTGAGDPGKSPGLGAPRGCSEPQQSGGVIRKRRSIREGRAPLATGVGDLGKGSGPGAPQRALSLNNLACLYYNQGQDAMAEPLYQRALAIWEKALGPDHPNVAMSLNNLAGLYRDQGQDAMAEPLLRRALAIQERALGSEHPDVAHSLNGLAELYDNQGQDAKAEALYQRALAIEEKAPGPGSPKRSSEPQQSGFALLQPRSIREGRAPLPAGAGDQGKSPWLATSGRGPEPQLTSGALRRPRPIREGRATL
jgi:tetratricopeptide (TPR) repeat protein